MAVARHIGGSGGGDHETLDTLVHNIAENNHTQLTYTDGRVTSEVIWTDVTETVKIRETEITYVDGRVSQVVNKQYDGAGSLIVGQTITSTITYVDGRVDHIDEVQS